MRSDDLGARGIPDPGEFAAGNVERAGKIAKNLLRAPLFHRFS
jgi:hypothetical protein